MKKVFLFLMFCLFLVSCGEMEIDYAVGMVVSYENASDLTMTVKYDYFGWKSEGSIKPGESADVYYEEQMDPYVDFNFRPRPTGV